MDPAPNSLFKDKAESQSRLPSVAFGWIYSQVIYTLGKKKNLVPVSNKHNSCLQKDK